MSEQLKVRTKKLALGIIKLVSQFPRRLEIQHIHGQMLRSSSSVAANYRAAFRARSKAEFIAKLGVVEEECDETQFWLELLNDAAAEIGLKLDPKIKETVAILTSEADQILRIMVKSRKTAKDNLDYRG